MKKENKGNLLAFLSFIVVYTLILLPIRKGIGNYWDWQFPYFQENIKNYFLYKYTAWTSLNLGSPLSYNSDYIFRGLISIINIKPEILLLTIILFIVSIGSLGAFIICRKNNSKTIISFILALIAFVNPTIFYKLLAGHIDYLVSYTIFIYFLLFIIYKYDNSLKSSIIAGLIFAFIGVQIQFFIFAFIFLLIFMLINYKTFKKKNLFIILLIVLLINSFWLTNFLLGVNNISEISNNANIISFKDSSQSELINIFTLQFSKATQIYRIYNEDLYPIFFISFLSVSLIIGLLNIKNKNNLSLFIFLSIVIFLGTGTFNKFNIWPLSIFHPIFRESGHFAPMILISLTLMLSFVNFKKKIFNSVFVFIIILFLILNSYIYINNYPTIDFTKSRGSFNNFNALGNLDNTLYRILTYPFFTEYSFLDQGKKEMDGFILSNSGYDSYITYSGKDSINNYVSLYNFNQSIQYFFIKSGYSTENLIKYNIKYIYDFSDIYESNYEKYVPAETYENNLSLIKNDPNFMNKIIQNNKDKVTLIVPHIIKLNNFLPRAFSNSTSFRNLNPTKYNLYVKDLKETQNLSFLESYHKDWKLYLVKNPSSSWCNPLEFYNNTQTTECEHTQKFFEGEELSYLYKKPIFDDTHQMILDYANGWTINPQYIKDNYSKDYYTTNPDGSIDIEFVMYFLPQSYFYIGLIISGTTFLACIGYLIWDWRKSKKQKSIFKNQ